MNIPLGLAIFFFVLVGFCSTTRSQDTLSWELGPTGSKASFRACSVVSPGSLQEMDEPVIWIAGSGGSVLRSEDGGSSWISCAPQGMPADLEFRSLYAASSSEAVVASAGTPAVILRTANAGQEWEEVYRHESPQAFFDAMRFWDNQRGIAFSDPVDGRLLVVETEDGGRHWREVETTFQALPGEAGFAASNSALCLGEGGAVWIGLGGVESETSRILFRANFEAAWEVSEAPIPSSSSSGVFSVAVQARADGEDILVAVGGDYRPDATSRATGARSVDGGRTWELMEEPPTSFRSAVAHVRHKDWTGWVCLGPTGMDISEDGSRWSSMNAQAFHALELGGNSIYATGGDGKFGRMRISSIIDFALLNPPN